MSAVGHLRRFTASGLLPRRGIPGSFAVPLHQQRCVPKQSHRKLSPVLCTLEVSSTEDSLFMSYSSAAKVVDVSNLAAEARQGYTQPPTYVKATGRIVAVGDLHGDMSKTCRALQVAGVLALKPDGSPQWCGGDTVVVQLGDVMDRGDHEIAIIMLLRELDMQARKEGGGVYMLNGNHESLNICGDFRYVTPGAFQESALVAGLSESQAQSWELKLLARQAMYLPGGPMAIELAKNPTVLVVNDTAFAHGGLLPIHVAYGVERMNAEVAAWMRGDSSEDSDGKMAPPFLAMGDSNSVMWNRVLSKEQFPSPYHRYRACNALSQALTAVGAKRLVVGHTPQMGGANCECDGMVWRIDVGMSYGVLDAVVQVLEIRQEPDGKSAVSILTDQEEVSLYEEGSVASLDFFS